MKVSVLIITYNHANFIAQAVDSALMQRACFDYEILISEDCSTDGTREIVIDYQNRHPDIRLLLSETNIRSNAVVARGIEAAKGDYLALLDGDDYWTDSHKLQKQADYLDNHPECSMCFHNARVVHDDDDREPYNWTPPEQKTISTLEDIWLGNFIATCSTMFRRGLIGEIPDWYDALFPITDWPLHVLNAEYGTIGYIDEVMGVYRYHEGGFYSPLGELEKLARTLDFYRTMNANLNYKYDRIINVATSKYFFEWAEEYAKRGDVKHAKMCFKTCLSGRPINKFVTFKQLVKTGLRLYVPLSQRWNFLAHQ